MASKFAVRGLVTTLAYELAPDIRVNGVAPGGTLSTDLRGLTTFGLNTERLDDTPDREADLASRNPLKVALSGRDHSWSFVYPRVRPGPGCVRQRHPHRRRHECQGVVATRRQIRSGGVTMPLIKAEYELCQGYANCVVGAEDVFDLDDDGVVVLLKSEVEESDRARVDTAARSCPVSALRLEDA